jgi:hypothetical protein
VNKTTLIRSIVVLYAGLCLRPLPIHAQLIDLTAWRINTTGANGHSTDATTNSYVSVIPSDVQKVSYTTDYVYVQSTGVPSYDVGPFADGNPAQPSDKAWKLRFTRNPQAATGTHTATGLGSIGLLVNGVTIYNPKDAHSYNNQNVWHNNAAVVEADGFDAALGHPSPGQTNPILGTYHHHQLSPSLAAQLGISAAQFSPLLGFAFDGFPIYGPYGYANANGTGGITRMTSSYRLRSITQRQSGPAVSATYPLGYFIEDYEYVSGLGLLDQYNGRFTVTPDYPSGTYAYFATIDANGANAYPYLIGPNYYGVLDTNDTTGSVTIPAAAVQYHSGDFNGNGVVDVADYVLWRKESSRQADYNKWQAYFGVVAGSGAGDSSLSEYGVPEPSSSFLLGICGALGYNRRLRRMRRIAQ